MKSGKTVLTSMLVIGCAASMCLAQASFTENFDNNGAISPGQYGPDNLISRGWIFRTQSSPPSYYSSTFFDGSPSWMSPHSGSGYLAVSYYPNPTGSGPISQWGILPATPNQIAGDALTFWLQGMGPLPTQHVEVRYSPTGGTSTGSGPTEIGDFAQVLADINPIPTGWIQHAVKLPGSGRIAIRLVDQYVFGNGSPYIGIDTLSVGPPPPPPCNQPPIPSAGETVNWTAAGGPYRMCTNIAIPVGATVNIEAGTTVNFDADISLTVAGTVHGLGTAANPISLTAPAVFPPMIFADGTLDMAFTNFSGQIRPQSHSTLLLHDCNFSGNGLIWSNGTDTGPVGQYVQPYVLVERCTFSNSTFTCSDCLVVFRNATMDNSHTEVLRGYADTTGGIAVSGQPFIATMEALIQPLYIDHVSATGVTTGGGLQLSGANFSLGSNNLIQNNLYPVDLLGGLARGSVVPPAGNQNNLIYAHGGGGLVHHSIWPNLGVPYFLDDQTDNPCRTIDPGVNIKFGPYGGMRYVSTIRLAAEATPAQPILMHALNPLQPWFNLSFQDNLEANRLEYCDIRDSRGGASASGAELWVDNCLFQDNLNGANANTYGDVAIRNSRFLNNSVGISLDALGGFFLNFPGNPNSFAGNGTGISSASIGLMDARNNWWNSPSGPQSPQNPVGTGDSIVGAVSFSPFATQGPDFGNHPPVVRIVEPGYTLRPIEAAYFFEPGQKFILNWTATDDDQIVSQRIQFSVSGNYPAAFTTIATLPPDARSYQLTIPSVPFDAAFWGQFFRVVAVDSTGKDGWDEIPCTIATMGLDGNVTITSPAAGQTIHAGDPVPPYQRIVTGFTGQLPTFNDYLIFEADGSIYLSGGPVGYIPNVSTDLARFWTAVSNNSNDIRWFPGPYVTVRHDPRLGFQPPIVQLQSPATGATFGGGSIVPIAWTASAAEGLRSFDIQCSVDGGRFWRTIATELPDTARSFDWQLPTIANAVSDARVRVIARDKRFQNTSDGTNRSFSILPGPRLGDINGDGLVNSTDIGLFVAVVLGKDTDALHVARADLNHDGTADGRDAQQFVTSFISG